MAHSCPVCDEACYCGGDIDDIFDCDLDAQDNCTHCLDSESEDEDDGAEWNPTTKATGDLVE